MKLAYGKYWVGVLGSNWTLLFGWWKSEYPLWYWHVDRIVIKGFVTIRIGPMFFFRCPGVKLRLRSKKEQS